MDNSQKVVGEQKLGEEVVGEQDEVREGNEVGQEQEVVVEVEPPEEVKKGTKGKTKGKKRTKRNTIESLNTVNQDKILDKMKEIFNQHTNYQFTLPIMLSKDPSLLENERLLNEIKNRTIDKNNAEFFKLKAGGPQRIVNTPVYKKSVEKYITLENINNENLDRKIYNRLNNKPIEFFKTYYKPENKLIGEIQEKIQENLQENSVNEGKIETPVPKHDVVNFYNFYMTKSGIDKHKDQKQALESYYNNAMNKAIKNGIDAYRIANKIYIPPVDETSEVLKRRGILKEPKLREKLIDIARQRIAHREGGERKTKKAKKSRQTKKAKKAKTIRKSQKQK